jgi:hypothetical protein
MLETEWGAKVVDEQEVTVADVPQQPMDTWEATDTARLIAAAPELYAALANLYDNGLIVGAGDHIDEVRFALNLADTGRDG